MSDDAKTFELLGQVLQRTRARVKDATVGHWLEAAAILLEELAKVADELGQA